MTVSGRSPLREGAEIGLGCLVLVIGAVLFGWMLFGFPLPRDDEGKDDRPEPKAKTLLQWQHQGSQCADGWPSTSIGRRGACSHHGGVVTRWATPDGFEVTCSTGLPPLTVEEWDAQMKLSGRIYC